MPKPATGSKRFRRSAFALAFAAALIGPAGQALATNVSGTISTDTTWTAANSPYVMTGNVIVASGVTLTIEPGVTVQGNSSSRYMSINGSLAAAGTESSPITFTSTADSASGQWGHIRLNQGASGATLKHVHIRFGGFGNGADVDGMVEVKGGAVTIEDSNFSDSAVSGLRIYGGSSGAGTSVTVQRSKFERNGFYGTQRHGDGINVFNAAVTIADSASWSNAGDGLDFTVGDTFTGGASALSGSSVWANGRYGVYVFQDPPVTAKAPDGNVAGEPPNAIYDNGSFGFSYGETWQQLRILRASSDIDWTGTYWGPVTVLGCGVGSQRGHLSYGAPDPDPATLPALQTPRGPVSHDLDHNSDYTEICANDDALVDPPTHEQPDLHFDPPPPTFGGLLLGQTFGCSPCNQEDLQLALAHDRQGIDPFEHTPWPVNTASGTLTETASDVRLPGPGIPFAWTRTYNSRDTSAGGFGTGWAHPYEAKVAIVDTTTGELEYRAGSGQLTRFTKVSGGATSGAATFYAKGFDGSLKRLSNNTYEMVTRDQRKLTFDSSGKLTQIKPRFGPATTLAYSNGKLSSITDSAGRTINVTYSGANPTLIDRVTLPDGRYAEYGYTSGRLTSVRDLRAKTTTLDYNADGLLKSIKDPSDHFLLQDITYDAQGRVVSEENGTGDAVTYDYSSAGGYDVTEVTVPGRGTWVYRHRGYLLMEVEDPLGRTTSYTYDADGHKATATDGRGKTTRLEYDIAGNVTKEVAPQPLGHEITRTFNSTNDLLSEKDGRANTTSYAYATASDPAADYQTGQLKTITDREGGTTTLKYWTSTSSPTPPAATVGLLKSLTNARGKTTSYAYDSQGNLTKLTSPLGLKTTMGHDASGRLTSRRDPRGNLPDPPAGYLTEWTYDDADNVATLTDARGETTSFDYHDNGLLWKQTRTEDDGTARVTKFDYDDADRLWKTTDPRNGVETRLYWPDGQLKSLASPEGRKASYDYDSAGQLATVVEPNGNAPGATASDFTWTYAYDDAGNRTSESHPDGGTLEVDYDALNRPVGLTDALGHETTLGYDANSNLTARSDPLGHSRTYAYDKLDRLTSATDERNKTWTYTYYATGEPESETTPLGNETSYGIDDDGRTISMVEPRGNAPGASASDYTWSYELDAAGNRTQVTDPLGGELAYAYDELDNVVEATDQLGNATEYEYDSLNRLKEVTPPAAGATGTLATTYEYDGSGNLAKRTAPTGHTTTWEYDLDALATEKTTPVGTWDLAYDANRNLKSVETPAGNATPAPGDGTISYGYDRMSRPTATTYSDSTADVSRSYDLAGRPQSQTDGPGTISYAHDNADRLTAIARSGAGGGLNGTLTYAYDDAGNVTERTYPGGTTATQAFDADGRLTSIASAGKTTSFGYDATANLTTVTLPTDNGHAATRSFDRAGRLTAVENKKGSAVLSAFAWTLDAAGNPTKVKTTRDTTDTHDVYEYDARNRLTGSCFGVAASATACAGAANSITYAYDKASNRTQEVRTGSVPAPGTTTYAYNGADQLTSTTKGGQTTTYTYDQNGNLASAGGRTFTYNLAGQLAATKAPGLAGETTAYAYDGDGRRVASTNPAADLRYLWDPLAESGIPEPILERKPGGTLVRRYLNGPLGAYSLTTGPGATLPGLPDPVPVEGETGTFYLHQDPLQSTTDLTEADGDPQWRYAYDGFGSEREATKVAELAPENRLRFNAQYLDPETVNYHLRARQYDPALGRFSALDPLEPPLTWPYEGAYVYVGGRPTTLTDPLGLSWGNPLQHLLLPWIDVDGAVEDVVGTGGDALSVAAEWGWNALGDAAEWGGNAAGDALGFAGRNWSTLLVAGGCISSGPACAAALSVAIGNNLRSAAMGECDWSEAGERSLLDAAGALPGAPFAALSPAFRQLLPRGAGLRALRAPFEIPGATGGILYNEFR